MLISKNWIQQFVTIPKDLSPEALASKLTLSTVEVEGIKKLGGELDGIVVGQVHSVDKHPNADRLKVCAVDIGERNPVQVVCGGSNVWSQMFVAFAKVGARVRWHGEGEPVVLEKTTIRGMDSHGMICGADEIGLEEIFPKNEEKEIVDLTPLIEPMTKGHINPFKHVLGKPLAEVLGLDDVVFDIDNKSLSNRPDLWGHYGMAREVAAITGGSLKPWEASKISKKRLEIRNQRLEIEVKEKELCPRYMAVAIDGIEVGPSPSWMQTRLLSVGVNPINNIVDITNYVMLELGQPMHAFDAGSLDYGLQSTDYGKNNNRPSSVDCSPLSIIIRKAKKGEKIITLKNEECKLSPEMLVIADSEKPIAVAGVIGGLETAITEMTTSIIFESANFNPASVRKTANALGVRTDSSARFEKSLDPTNAEVALCRAVELTLELNPKARVASDVVDVSHFKINQGPIALPLLFVEKKLGVRVEKKKIISILSSLGFGVKEKRDVLFVSIPTWRATKDISIPEDVVEEILRVYGYDHIPASLPRLNVAPPLKNSLRELERHIKELLAYEYRMTEVYNYSFESPEWLAKLGVDMDQYLELDNPIAKDRPILRKHLIPNMLENVEKNAHRFDSVRLFEVGRMFDVEKQDTMLGLVSAGKGVAVPFYDLSHVVLGLGTRLDIAISVVVAEPQAPFTHPGRHAHLKVGKQEIGRIAELHPATQEQLGIPYRTAIVQINLDKLLNHISSTSSYRPLSQYPSIERDIAFVVDHDIEHVSIVQTLKSVDPLIASVQLFDVYEGKGIEKGKKSMAYRIIYRSDDRTLTAEEVDTIQKKVVPVIEKKFGGEVRK